MFRRIYLSPVWIVISLCLRFLSLFHKPFMVYGYYNKVRGKYFRNTRIGSNVKLSDKKKIDIADHVWIGHFSLLDGIGGIEIGDGVNIASHTCVYTHSSENSIRLLGDRFIHIPAEKRPGYILGKVTIGAFTFIGTGSIILPGTQLGKGCIVGAGSVVKGIFPDYSIVVGNPAKIIGSSLETDKELLASGLPAEHYYDRALIDNGFIRS
jgi:acetyltransferase-like isoleucine patch superfamily enzyme